MSKHQLSIDNSQVPEGYKKTEVGVIPEDWEVKQLGDILHLKNGFAFRSEYFSLSGPIVLTPGNFRLDGGLYFNDKNTKRYSGKFPELMIFQKGDLLVVMTDLTPDCNLLGKPAFVYSEEIILHNQRIGKINLLSEHIDNNFLYCILLSSLYLKKIKEQATGSTVRHTSNKSIYSIYVPIPPLPEQRAIAQTLSDVDGLIAALDKAIAKKRNIKTGTMQELLTGKKRLPGFGKGKGYKNTEVGVIPEDWEVISLGELTSFVRSGKSVVKKKIGNYPLYGSTGVISYSQSFEYEGDAILVARVGANAGKVNFVSGKYCVSDNTIIVKFKNNSNIHFFIYQLRKKKLNSLVFGSGQPLITGTQLKNLSVLKPKLEEERAIASILSDMDAEIAALEKRRAKTKAMKQGMMQELLTGKTRLIDPNNI